MVAALSTGAWIEHKFPATYGHNSISRFFFPGALYGGAIDVDQAAQLPLSFQVRGWLVPWWADYAAGIVGRLLVGLLFSFIVFQLLGPLLLLGLPSLAVIIIQYALLLGWLIANLVGPLAGWINAVMCPLVLGIWTGFVHYILEPLICAVAWMCGQGWDPLIPN